MEDIKEKIMPTSDPNLLTPVIRQIMAITPYSILDVGAGYGKWGVLVKEYLGFYMHRGEDNIKIDAVEIWEPYIKDNKIYEEVYDRVYIGDVKAFNYQQFEYDLILMCDVIEHMTKDEGIHLIKEMQKSAKHIIITTPSGHTTQGASWGNPHESHICGWSLKEFQDLSFKSFLTNHGMLGVRWDK